MNMDFDERGHDGAARPDVALIDAMLLWNVGPQLAPATVISAVDTTKDGSGPGDRLYGEYSRKVGACFAG